MLFLSHDRNTYTPGKNSSRSLVDNQIMPRSIQSLRQSVIYSYCPKTVKALNFLDLEVAGIWYSYCWCGIDGIPDCHMHHRWWQIHACPRRVTSAAHRLSTLAWVDKLPPRWVEDMCRLHFLLYATPCPLGRLLIQINQQVGQPHPARQIVESVSYPGYITSR